MNGQNAKLVIVVVFLLPFIASGLRAAWLWRKSTMVALDPQGFEPVDPDMRRIYWEIARREASDRSAGFNRRAAWWTTISAIFGCAAGIAGAWPTSD